MGMTWTEEQKKVIDVRNKNVLVSAAAGSGKTAVLVERILSIVCGDMEGEDPVDVDRLLVVTFTKAAAAEMRERVGLALERRLEADPENEHLQKQQTLIHNAQITTIDSFCQYVIRNYFHQIDLDPSFRIGDEGELKLLKGDVVRELLEDHYAEENPEEAARFTEFVETYATGKSDAGLETLILQLYEAAISYPYPKRWLSQCMAAYRDVSPEALEKSSWMEYLLTLAGQTFSDLKEELQEMREFCRTPGGPYMYEDAIRSDLEQAETLASCRTYEEIRLGLSGLSFARLSPKKDESVDEEKKNQVKAFREGMKKSLKDLKLSYIDLYFVHWPFPNYHAPGCDGDSRNPDSRPFSVEEFMVTWRQCERLVDEGKVRYIGMSNMTIPKLEAVLPLCRIKPAALEMELHPGFQQPELFEYAKAHDILPVGYCPIGSPSRPERDRTAEDVADTQMPEIVEIAERHHVHPALICLKWAVQRGQVPIPFSVKEPQYISNLKCATEDPLTEEEMETIRLADKNCRLVKGQVFLWPGAKGWEDLWDLDGTITG